MQTKRKMSSKQNDGEKNSSRSRDNSNWVSLLEAFDNITDIKMIANCLMWVMATARCKKIRSKQNHMYMCIEMMMLPMQAIELKHTQKKDRDQFERLIQTCWISEIAYACTKYPIITTVNLFLFLWQKKRERKEETNRQVIWQHCHTSRITF